MNGARVKPPAEREVAEAVATGIQDVLGDGLMAVYLSGSAVTGGFEAGISDLDLVVVTAGAADRIDLAALDRMHRDFVGRSRAWADRIEAVYVGRATLRSFRTSTDRLAVISPGEPLHLRDEAPALWLQNWYLVREVGVPLLGPAPTEIVPPITWREFVEATTRYAGEVASRIDGEIAPGALAYALLTSCRAVMTVQTDTDVSKAAAATWASERMPESAWLIEAALRCRRSHGRVGFDDATTQAAARTLIRRLAAEIGAT